MTADILRALLLITIVLLALFSVFYLRQRQLSWAAYCFWGLVALLIPVLGPLLVIAFQPGRPGQRAVRFKRQPVNLRARSSIR